MNLLIFIGTHLPELHLLWRNLLQDPLSQLPASLIYPDGLPLPESTPFAKVLPYPPGQPQAALAAVNDPTAYLLIDPRQPLIAQLEAIAAALQAAGREPLKIVTLVDCAAAENSPQLRAYLEAAIYYTDTVLLGNRATASKKFVHDYQRGFEKRCYPCEFLLLKANGGLAHSEPVLLDGVRRISQLFDLPDSDAALPADLVVEASCDLDLEEPEVDPFRQPGEDSAPVHLPDVSAYVVGFS